MINSKLHMRALKILPIISLLVWPLVAISQTTVYVPVENVPMNEAHKKMWAMAQKPIAEQNWRIIIAEYEKIYDETQNNEAANLIRIIYLKRMNDYPNSMIWLKKAAEGGLVDTKLEYAVELKKDPSKCGEALNWLNQMPDWQGAGYWEKAKYYEDGLCAPIDLAKARSLHELAAKRGELRAQYRLSIMMKDGIGGPRDLLNAYAWMYIVRNTRNGYAELRNAPSELDALKEQLKTIPLRTLMRRVRSNCAIDRSVCSLMSDEGIRESGFRRGY